MEVDVNIDQEEFIEIGYNDLSSQILDLYQEASSSPRRLILVCHSMGGFVARATIVNPMLKKELVETLVTLSSPHQSPPFVLQPSFGHYYSHVNEEWRKGYTGPEPTLSHIIVVSISAGVGDYQIVFFSVAVIFFALARQAHYWEDSQPPPFLLAAVEMNFPISSLPILAVATTTIIILVELFATPGSCVFVFIMCFALSNGVVIILIPIMTLINYVISLMFQLLSRVLIQTLRFINYMILRIPNRQCSG